VQDERRFRTRLVAILAAGVLVRVWAILAIPTRPVSDFFGYFEVAKNLAATGRYETEPGVPDGRRSPAYPVLLSFAWRAEPGEALLAAKLLNVGLFALAGLAGAVLSRRLWGETAGLWTAAILAFLPRSILMTDLLAAENLLAPLLLAFLLLCAASWTSGESIARAAGLGALAGLLCLTRAVLYFVPLVWLAGALTGRLGTKRIVRELLVMLVVVHAVMLPWAIRNARTLSRFTPFNLVGGVGIFIANNPNATGQWYPWSDDLERLRPGVFARGAAATDDAAREEAGRWIRDHPGAALRGYLRRLGIILKDDAFAAEFAIFAKEIPQQGGPVAVLPEGHPLERHRPLVRLVLRISGALLAVAALGGFWLLVRGARKGSLRDRALTVGFLAAALYVPLLSAAMAVNGRYRWAAEDVIAPLAGLFLARLGGAAGFESREGERPRENHLEVESLR
jgi:4-amino-4-deoxy-L-arabinose transferase-like glycosyltransferase